MLIARATASPGTPAGGATVIVSRGWSGRAKPGDRLSKTALGGDRHVATSRRARRRTEPPVDVDDDVRRRRRPDVDRAVGAELHDRPVGTILGGAVVDRRGVGHGLSGRPRGEEAGGLRPRGGDGHRHRRRVRRNTALAQHRDADSVGADRRESGPAATVRRPAWRDRLEPRCERCSGRSRCVEWGRDHQRGEHRRDGDPSRVPEVGHRETSRFSEREDTGTPSIERLRTRTRLVMQPRSSTGLTRRPPRHYPRSGCRRESPVRHQSD